jgi:hypothetical protein
VGYIVPSIFIWITMFPVGEDKNWFPTIAFPLLIVLLILGRTFIKQLDSSMYRVENHNVRMLYFRMKNICFIGLFIVIFQWISDDSKTIVGLLSIACGCQAASIIPSYIGNKKRA